MCHKFLLVTWTLYRKEESGNTISTSLVLRARHQDDPYLGWGSSTFLGEMIMKKKWIEYNLSDVWRIWWSYSYLSFLHLNLSERQTTCWLVWQLSWQRRWQFSVIIIAFYTIPTINKVKIFYRCYTINRIHLGSFNLYQELRNIDKTSVKMCSSSSSPSYEASLSFLWDRATARYGHCITFPACVEHFLSISTSTSSTPPSSWS